MPTKPIMEILPRELPPDIEKILSEFSGLIDEIVNYGTHVLAWCADTIKSGDEYIPIIMIYRHILELEDSISILIKKSCVEPCKILLRGIFESLLSAEYILEEDTKRRGKSYLIWSRHNN